MLKWVLLMLAAASLNAETLTRDAYLAQVQQGNLGFKAMQNTETVLKLVALEPDTMLSPYINADVNYFDDQSVPAISFEPNRTTVTNWDVTLSKQFGATGTRLSLGYKGSDSDYVLRGFTPGAGLTDNYFNQNGGSVGIVQPLWKDLGARGHDIAKRKVDASTGSARMMNKYGAAATLFEAESAYISLSTARQIALLLEESLERNNKIREWTQDKYNDNLVDKVDLLQVDAALSQVKAGLSAARQDLKNAAEKFNTLRGASTTAEIGELQPLAAPSTLPTPGPERLDLQAAALTSEGNSAAADEVKERYTPDLSLIANYTNTAGAVPGANDVGKPTYVVGLKLSSILDIPLYNKVVSGAAMAASLSKDDLVQKRLNADLDWKSLQSQWATAQEQLVLANELEAIQKEKAERERKRYQDGSTTNFQVLRFDEDYNQARIGALRLNAQAAILAAQAEFYNGGKLTW